MAMTKWDPMQELQVMQEEMNRLFQLSRSRLLREPLEPLGWQPPVDIFEDDAEVVVKMEIPGVDQEDVQVEVRDDQLIIQGERKLEREDRRHFYHRIECSYGPFRRTFVLPASVLQDCISARCDRGVLTIVLPKEKQLQARQIEVQAEG